DRLHRLARLVRKYGGESEIASYRERAARELAELESAEERIAERQSERERALERAATAARELSAARRKIAEDLGTRIGDELGSLGMGGARIVVEVAPLAEREG